MTHTFDGPHDFAEPGYRKTLLGLFQPGNGVTPPTLAGRKTERDVFLDRVLAPLQARQSPARDLVLYGPRGNGKTVLLTDFERHALEAGVGVISLLRQKAKSPIQLAKSLLATPKTSADAIPSSAPGGVARATSAVVGAAQRVVSDQHLTVDGVTVGAPGLGTVSLGTVADDDLSLRVVEMLTGRGKASPLLVTVDEAHTLDHEVGQDLLNISQELRRQRVPFGLILVGTPNLETRMSAIDASFWSRAELLPIGRISAAAVAEALTEPLAGLSVTFDPAALKTVVEDSQRYPYFTQLWGEALCAVLIKEIQEHIVTPATVAHAHACVEDRRQRYYGERYKEMRRRNLLAAAVTVATVFDGVDQAHEDSLIDALHETPGLDAPAAAAALVQLAALGYTWQVTSANDWFEPGIPSLMTHVQERWQATIAHRAQPSALCP